MKYSYSWLKELSDTKLSPEKAAELLTMHSFEIESLEKNENKLAGVIVGEILEIKKHPNADKLQIAKVDVGTKESTSLQSSPCKGEGVLSIVCGAKNIAVGQKVPVATVGTKLPGGKIEEAEIRGEKSFGMLCAEDELGLGKNHEGILILDKKAKVGESVMKYLGLNDNAIEIKVLPDRAHDILSHIGVAREIAVLENRKFDYDFEGLKLPKIKSKNNLSIKIEDKKLCKRYIGAVMEGIEIKESPKWLRNRLEICGFRPINNVVDATNYIMLETGQPLHAFDAEKLKVGNSKFNIVVRRAKNDEKLILLDDTEIKLSENNLLITNGKTPLALAGIMGGKDSGISEKTKTIVIEAASFDAINVRKTKNALNLKTDASDRFEKELDPNLTEIAMVRIMEMLEHIASGKAVQIVDVYPKKIKPWKIKLDIDYVNSLLGEKIPESRIIKILNLLNIKTKKGKLIECEIPTYRLDIRTEEDLIEEIGRIYGYENISPRPIVAEVLPAKANKQIFFERKIQDIMLGLGYDEMYNYSFYSRENAKKCGLDESAHFELVNPMNPEQELVRASMTPNILKNIKENLKNFEEFNIFEISRTYSSEKSEIEERRIIFAAQVFENNEKESFYLSKGNLENLLESLGIKKGILYKENETHLKDYWCNIPRSAKVEINGITVGYVGEISSLALEKYKIKNPVSFFDLDAEKLLSVLPKEKTFHSISKFPTVTRDISMIAPEEVSYAQVCDAVKKTGSELIQNVSLFDYFEAKKSLAIRIELGAKDQTLESAEIYSLMEKITSVLEKELGVEIRK